jgi:hypothetical protein
MAECIVVSETTGTLRGICPDCDRMVYRRVNPQQLGAVCGDLDVTVTQARPRILRTGGLMIKQARLGIGIGMAWKREKR